MIFKVVLSLTLLSVLSCKVLNHRAIYNSDYNHKDAKKFKNVHKTIVEKSKYDEIDFLKDGEKAKKSYFEFNKKHVDPGFDLVKGYDYKEFTVKPNLNLLKKPTHDIQVTYIGHATFFIQLGKRVNILTDPQFSKLPFAWLFEKLKRHAPPAIYPYDLPRIHAVTISHDHYDHMDPESLEMLDREVDYLAPLRFEGLLSDITEKLTLMDWYTSVDLKGVEVTFLPVQHWSNRGMFDRNERLWGGFMYVSHGRKIYFSGDTAYSGVFKEIKKKKGGMDICLFPIISYKPFSYRGSHVTPELALRAAEDLGCKVFIPWGQGTFTLGNVHMLEPLRRLKMAYKDRKWPFKLKILKMGETAAY